MRMFFWICMQFMSAAKIFFGLSSVYGIGLSFLFAWGLWFQDMPALEQAVQSNSQHAEMRHRINVFADGVWFLLANVIVINSLAAMNQVRKND